MIKKLLITTALFVGTAHANDLKRLDLQNASVADFAETFFGQMQESNYILAPELTADQRVISIHLEGKTEKFEKEGLSYLKTLGYSIEYKNNVYTITLAPLPKEPEKKEPHRTIGFYKPKFRSVKYLTEQLKTITTDAKFSGQQGKNLNTSKMSTDPKAVQVLNDASNTSAAGSIDKTDDILVYNATDADAEQIKDALPQIDTPKGMMIVKATVFEVTTTLTDASAISVAATILGQKLGLALNPTGALSNALTIENTAASSKAVISALNDDNRFHVLSSPVAQARSGSTASFKSGESVPVLQNVSYNSTGTAIQGVQYQDAGVIFEVTPIKRENTIAMTIHQELSNFTATTTGVNNSPTLNKRSIDSELDVQPGAIVLLGGLTEDDKTTDDTGVSFLPSFLDSKTKDTTHSEIILVLQVSEEKTDTPQIPTHIHITSQN